MTKKNPVIRDKCGTHAGWNAHQKNGEAQCAPCQEAHTTYQREYRRRTGRTKSTLVPLSELRKPVVVSIAHMEGTVPFAYIAPEEAA